MKQPCAKCKTVGVFTETCPKCRGRYGKECGRCSNEGVILESCEECQGTGYVEKDEETDK